MSSRPTRRPARTAANDSATKPEAVRLYTQEQLDAAVLVARTEVREAYERRIEDAARTYQDLIKRQRGELAQLMDRTEQQAADLDALTRRLASLSAYREDRRFMDAGERGRREWPDSKAAALFGDRSGQERL